MSDYYFETGVLRDQVVTQLVDNLEQTPYVLANVAEDLAPGTMGFDDFCDQLDTLDADQKLKLRAFCEALTMAIDPPSGA